jgi:acetyl esterase
MASQTDRLDPALHQFTATRTDLSPKLIGALRTVINARRREAAAALDTGGLDIADGTAAGVAVRSYRATDPIGVLLYCHSGAFVLGNLDIDHRQCVELAARAQCTVVAVDYRLAPEHPFPAALDDALAVLDWIAAEFPGDRIAVAGNSAGGALAALIAQRSPLPVFQLLHQPVLDDRTTSSKREFRTTPGFDGDASAQMWQHYSGSAAVPVAAVPARAVDLAGAPAAFITCSELDPLRDEAIDYASRLLRAGVATELYVVPGTCHGFDSLLPDWDVSQRVFGLQADALRRALRG